MCFFFRITGIFEESPLSLSGYQSPLSIPTNLLFPSLHWEPGGDCKPRPEWRSERRTHNVDISELVDEDAVKRAYFLDVHPECLNGCKSWLMEEDSGIC